MANQPPQQLVSAHDVARELRRRVPGLSSLQLHKLLYYVQGWHLTFVDRPLYGERIEAWANGPVVADLWHSENKHRAIPSPTELDDFAMNTVGYVISRYGGLSADDLVHLTHEEDPWRDASASGVENAEITADALKNFFANEQRTSATARVLANAISDPQISTLFDKAVARTLLNPGAVTDVDAFVARVANGN